MGMAMAMGMAMVMGMGINREIQGQNTGTDNGILNTKCECCNRSLDYMNLNSTSDKLQLASYD